MSTGVSVSEPKTPEELFKIFKWAYDSKFRYFLDKNIDLESLDYLEIWEDDAECKIHNNAGIYSFTTVDGEDYGIAITWKLSDMSMNDVMNYLAKKMLEVFPSYTITKVDCGIRVCRKMENK